jgi:hypothetical protein
MAAAVKPSSASTNTELPVGFPPTMATNVEPTSLLQARQAETKPLSSVEVLKQQMQQQYEATPTNDRAELLGEWAKNLAASKNVSLDYAKVMTTQFLDIEAETTVELEQ